MMCEKSAYRRKDQSEITSFTALSLVKWLLKRKTTQRSLAAGGWVLLSENNDTVS